MTPRRPHWVEFSQVLETMDASACFLPAESQSLGIAAAAATWATKPDTTTCPIDPTQSGALHVREYHADANKIGDDSRNPASFVPPDGGALAQTNMVLHSELMALRRRLARRHHPDLFPPEHKDKASRQMAMANATIDQRLRALKHS
jgi:hypothetical protein